MPPNDGNSDEEGEEERPSFSGQMVFKGDFDEELEN
jgi:hypothetical protein